MPGYFFACMDCMEQGLTLIPTSDSSTLNELTYIYNIISFTKKINFRYYLKINNLEQSTKKYAQQVCVANNRLLN